MLHCNKKIVKHALIPVLMFMIQLFSSKWWTSYSQFIDRDFIAATSVIGCFCFVIVIIIDIQLFGINNHDTGLAVEKKVSN